MKRYVNIRKINLNESKKILTEAYTTQDLKNKSAEVAKLFKSILPALETINANIKNIDVAKLNIKSKKTKSTEMNALNKLMTAIRAIPNNSSIDGLPGIIEKLLNNEIAKNLKDLVETAKQDPTFKQAWEGTTNLNMWYNTFLKYKQLYDDLTNAWGDESDGSMANAIANATTHHDHKFIDFTEPAKLKKVIEDLTKIPKGLGKKLDDLLGAQTEYYVEPAKADILNKSVENFKETILKLIRCFTFKHTDIAIEENQQIKTVFDIVDITGNSDPNKLSIDTIASGLLHIELFGINRPEKVVQSQIYFNAWANSGSNGSKIFDASTITLKFLASLVTTAVTWNVTTLNQLTALIPTMEKIISCYSKIYNTDYTDYNNNITPEFKVDIDQQDNNTGWAEMMVAVRTLIKNNPPTATQNTKSTLKDWELLLKQAKTADESTAIWEDYYQTEWGPKGGKYSQEISTQVKLLGKPFTNELLTLGFTADQNPFITYLKNNIKLLEDKSLTSLKYMAIHNAYLNNFIDATMLKHSQNDTKNSKDQWVNLIDRPNFIRDFEPATIYSYLEAQNIIFDAYKSAVQFSSDSLALCYLNFKGDFITDIFYAPGDPEVFAKYIINNSNPNEGNFNLAEIRNKFANTNTKGIGIINKDETAQIKDISTVRAQIDKCIKNKSKDTKGKATFKASGQNIIDRLGKDKKEAINFILYLYTSKGPTDKALDMMHKYKISENSRYDVSNTKKYANITSSLNIDQNNLHEVIEDIAKAANL